MEILNLIELGPRPYDDVDQLQRQLHHQIAAGLRASALIVCEMESVYTAGKRTGRADLRDEHLSVRHIDRGGRITWHGPGQIVVYPIVKLRNPIDVTAYACALEEAVIATAAHYGINADRVAGRSGVWLHDPERKLCAIGVRIARATTLHGLALNVTNSLAPYAPIIPCGIRDAGVTTLAMEGGNVSLAEVATQLIRQLTSALTPLIAPWDKEDINQ
ncbi:MAG: lipoyl(octanoyl) transferase LipB [Bowdeniella nasicola]|nr:lipoyl(octanoyl) transferase LipB [Bowdeniella nasicola]